MADQEPREGAADREPRGRSGDRTPRAREAGARKPRSGDTGSGGARRDGDRKPYAKRDGDRKPYEKRDGDRKPYEKRDGDRKPHAKREGDRKPYEKRDGDRKPYAKRDGDRPYAKPYAKRDGDRKPYERRDGDRKPYGGDRSDRPARGGANRPDTALRPEENRPVRPRHDDPIIPDDITPHDLNAGARNELKTLSKENAEQVARHLAMASQLIDEDPGLAHQHALSASRRAGRIAIVRETLAITAYATGDYALALRELRTYRRISGKDDQIALMVDSERGVGRPDRALELGRSIDRSKLPTDVRVELAIAMSGARLDLGDAERALLELDIPELDPDRAFEWSPALFAARATVLEELGRDEEAARWHERALVAADAIDAATGAGDLETVFVDEVIEEPHDEPVADGQSQDEPLPSVEDEVAELLDEAGIDDDEAGVGAEDAPAESEDSDR